jgi:Tfp pilus assembly protein PilN
MSVRVNLLPEATKQRGRANQQRLMALGAAGLLLLVLGGTWWWAANQVSQAEDRLAAEQSVTAGLRAEEAELIAFRDLADRREQAVETLIASMADEVSLAGVLQDLAAVMPEDAQMDTLAVNLQGVPERTDVIGNLVITGQTLTSHAPGVERMLLALEKVATFGELFLNSSTLEEDQVDPVATFSLEGAVRAEARTDRYVDGLPGDLR